MGGRLTVVLLWLVTVSSDAGAQIPEFETTRLGEGIYQFRYQTHNNFFVVTSAGIIAFDPISTVAAERYAAEMKRVAPGQPLVAIVYSHDHADHATGANVLRAAFGDDPPVIAHQNAAAKISDAGDADLPPPDLTFTERMRLHFGGRTVELHYLGKSHSDNMLVALLPEERIAFAVDFVTNDGVGFRDLPDYHFPDFFDALHHLEELDFESIAFGHGPPGDRGTIGRQIQYYSELQSAVTEAYERGWSEDRAAAEIKLPAYRNWRGYDDWFELNVRAIYEWIAGGGGG